MLLKDINCICRSLKTIKTPFKILKLQLKLVQHVSTQLGHLQATRLLKEFLLHCTTSWTLHTFIRVCGFTMLLG
jgi:hypothetical protein